MTVARCVRSTCRLVCVWPTAVAVLLAVALPPSTTHAACSWVDSVTGWNGSLAWSYTHQASWSALNDSFQGQTQDQLSASFTLTQIVQGSGNAQGVMQGTMSNYGHVDITSSIPGVLPGFTEHSGSGPFDAYAPPPPQIFLFLDSFSCTYTFQYGSELGAHGTSRVKSGCCVNSSPTIVGPGSLDVPPQLPIPELPQPLTFSGVVDAVTLPPLAPTEPFYTPTDPAWDSAEHLGEEQLGKASVQWAFQPTGFEAPLNDGCAGASVVSGIVQDTTFATTAASDPTPSCGTGDRSVWFLVQASESGTASVETTGSDYGTIVSVWPMAQPCSALTTQVACGAGTASWQAEAGQSYRVQITRGSGGGGGSLVGVVSVPEPTSAAWAAGLALLALATGPRGTRLRRRARREP
jgi:hypothetical protein